MDSLSSNLDTSPRITESSSRRSRDLTQGTEGGERTPLLQSRCSTEITSRHQPGTEDTPSYRDYPALFIASLKRCLPCFKSEEQAYSTQDASALANPAVPESVASVEPPHSPVIGIHHTRTVQETSSAIGRDGREESSLGLDRGGIAGSDLRRAGALESDGFRRGREIQESRLQDDEEQELIEKCIPFFERYDREANEILEQLPGVCEHLGLQKVRLGLDSEKEKELGLNAQDRAQIIEWERSKVIMDFPIPDMIKYLERDIKSLNEQHDQYQDKGITDENIKK